MKFVKSDIERVTKTNPIEDSLLVFQADGATSSYVEYAVIKIEGERIEVEDIERWIDAVPRFRDCYVYQNDQPVRIRFKKAFYPIEVINLQGEQDTKTAMAGLVSRVPTIDVQSPPLFRVIAFTHGTDTYLGVAYHHLLFDGISVQMVLSMLDVNRRFPVQNWQPNPSAGPSFLETVPTFTIEPLLPPAAQKSSGFLRLTCQYGGRNYEEVMLKWVEFIQQASGSDEVVIGEVLSARDNSVEAQQALGYFVQTWPLAFHGATDLAQLKAVRNARIAKADEWVNRHVPSQCFDHVWVVEPSLQSEHESLFWSTPHYPLTLVIQPAQNHVDLVFCWNLGKVDAQAAQQIFESFRAFLHNPSPAQRLPEFQSPDPGNLMDRWAASVSNFGALPAVKDGNGNEWTYEGLDDRAEALAARLDIRPGDRVGVHVTYSTAIPLAFLAILKRGGIYVPLDPTVTRERWEYILADAGIECVISDLPELPVQQVVHPTDTAQHVAADFEVHRPKPTETVNLIYTSGTTGQPKGCAVNHENLANLFEGTQPIFEFAPSDRWVMAHSYGFDFSTWEIWGCLLSGGQLYIPARETIQDTFAFYDMLSEHGITVLNQTPKAFDNLMLVDETGTGLYKVRHVIFGGDKLHAERLVPWKNRYPECSLTNMYGITETTVHVTAKSVAQEPQSNIGRTIPGYVLQCVNEASKPVPKGFIGEMHVFGLGVCNGYHGKPELTREKFGAAHTTRFYRTGDLGWQIGEETYYLGRKDRQVKIRGYRIELGEIEFQLQQAVPACQFIAALHHDQLVAFYKGASDGFDPIFFKGRLADYAIPQRFYAVDAFPLNASGKIDENALLRQLTESSAPGAMTSRDPAILEAMREILGNNILTERSFIQNGGDSITAIRLVNKLRKAQRTIAIGDLFETTAISMLQTAKLQEDAKLQHSAIAAFNQKLGFAHTADKFWIPLMEAQEGILFDCLRSDNSSLYAEQLTYELPASYDFEQIRDAYEQVCRHNPLLSARIDRQAGEYLLSIDRNAPVICTEISGQNWDAYLQQDFARGFDLKEGLTRIAVLPGEEHHRLVWTHHHLILDGWSLGVFSKEILKALNKETLTEQDAFMQLACATHLHSEQGSYWASKYIPAESSALPPPLPSREASSDAGYLKRTLFVPMSDFERVQEAGASLHAFCFTLWASFLCALYDSSTVVIGNVVSLRSDAHIDALGMYVRTLPFLFEFTESETMDQRLRWTTQRLREDERHKEELLGASTSALSNDHLFVFENYPVDHEALEAMGVRIGGFREQTGAPWTTLVNPVSGGFDWHVMHHSAHHNSSQVDTVLAQFSHWVAALNWHEPLSKMAARFPKEPPLIGPVRSLSGQHILALLKRNSNHPVIQGTDFHVTYTELWAAAEQLASRLQEAGFTDKEAVGIDVESTRHFASCILGVWLAGGVPTPVDKRYPEQRKEFVYQAVSARFILRTDADGVALVTTKYPKHTFPNSAGFILSTSGSTGVPKVVVQTLDCLINLIQWNRASFGMSEKDVILQLSSFGFDASFHEVLLAISLGASLVEVPLASRLDIQLIRGAIEKHAATQAWIPARLLNAVLDVDPTYFDECDSLQRIVTTGEALILSANLKNYVQRSKVSLLNYYGPTETHVVTALEVTGANLSTQPPIGRVLDNCTIRLMDSERNPTREGLPGEIWVADAPVAIGYHNAPELNAEAFAHWDGKRWYKTGDWAYIGPNGLLEFIGRKDSQLKIRGFRVEPLEVERTLSEITEMRQCCVLAKDEALHGFVVTELSTDLLVEESRRRLPDYMVPEHWHRLDEMPINQNGKADRKTLLRLASSSGRTEVKSNAQWKSTRAWVQALGHDQFKANSSFESVGGNSVLLMKMQAWIEKELDLFVSIRDLLLHNTPESMESLLENLPESNQVLPQRFPVHDLQRGILILEAGQNLDGHSPFWLGFKATLSERLSKKQWEDAVRLLLDQYPHLNAMLEETRDLAHAFWVRTNDLSPFLQPISPNTSTYGSALVRFIQHNETTIEVQWHHVLLDGLGVEVLLRNLKAVFEDRFQQRSLPLNSILHPTFNAQATNVRTSGEAAQVLTASFDPGKLQAVVALCERHRLSQSVFWQFLAAHAHQSSQIAVADVTRHPGFPGMFTELRPVQFNLSAQLLEGWIARDTESNEALDVIANFMTMMPDGDWVQRLEVSQPTHLKYPHEWQFIVSGTTLTASYYTAQTNATAKDTFEKFLVSVDRVLAGEALESKDAPAASEVFDEFDF